MKTQYKMGDYEGCGMTLEEMAANGHAPTQAAYTSLLAACYKICSDSGRVPHAVRAKAGEVGWKHWQEMRIVGIEPDVMAYGAIIRLCAARGQPERALGLLQDMERFDVKPTTLCFSAALKAVARSHETAIRFENGASKRNLRRETIAAHHGKMARQIVIMAETAEVEQDEGFVSALMLCAAAAGDSATAKAVFLASEVRKMDHLRTIGSKEPFLDNSLKQGEPLSTSSGQKVIGLDSNTSDSSNEVSNWSNGNQNNHFLSAVETFGNREYGKDTRVVSALIRSAAQAMNKNGIGDMWQGKENLGFLCDNSLRLITTRWEPSYRDTNIPGVNSTKLGIGALRRLDEKEKDEERKPGKRVKFRGMYVEDEDLPTIDDGNAPLEYAELNRTTDDEDDLFADDEEEFEKKFLNVPISPGDDRYADQSEVRRYKHHVFSAFLFCTLPVKTITLTLLLDRWKAK